MSLINSKVYLELNWTKNCVMSDNGHEDNNDETTFKITSTKLFIPIVALATKDNVKLTKHLHEEFKRPFHWNQSKKKIEPKGSVNTNPIRIYLDVSFQVVERLFVLLFDDGGDKKFVRESHRNYFLLRVNMTNYKF